jgi:hypothetical protein
MRALEDNREARFESMAVLANALEGTQPLPPQQHANARATARTARTATTPPIDPPTEDAYPRFENTRFFPVHVPAADAPASQEKAPQNQKAPLTLEPPPKPKPKPIREPKRAIVQPFADAALAELSVSIPLGFRKAVLIVTLDLEREEKARFFVQLVALDESAELWSPDASPDLVRAAGNMIAADAKDGNGRWQRLVLRLQRGSREAIIADVV